MGGVGSGSANRQKISGDELAGLLDAGLSAEVIADRLGCTARTVRNTAHRHRLALPSQRARQQRRVVAPRVAQAPAFPQLYEPGWLQRRVSAGEPLKVIAADVGCSVSTVRTAADRLDVTRRRAVQHPKLRDRAWLVDAYVTRGLTTAAIAEEIGASDSAVSAALARAGIPTRRPVRDPRLSEPGWLRRAYVDEQRSAPAIATHLGVHPQTVYLALARAGIARRVGGQRRWRVDADWLRSQYLDAGRSAVSIAAEVGQHPATVRTYLARDGIRRPALRRPRPGRLAAGWKRHRSLRELARRYRASPERVELWLAEIGIFVRPGPVVARRSLRTAMRTTADVSELAHRFGMRPMRMRIELLQHHLELRPPVAAIPPGAPTAISSSALTARAAVQRRPRRGRRPPL